MQVGGGRSSEKGAIDTGGISNERGGMLGSKLLSRRDGGAVREGGEVNTARSGSVGESGIAGVGEAAERSGSNKALRSGNVSLIAWMAQQANVKECV